MPRCVATRTGPRAEAPERRTSRGLSRANGAELTPRRPLRESHVPQVRALVIALSFHQFLEGIALASFIMRARVGRWKGARHCFFPSTNAPRMLLSSSPLKA